MMCVVVAVGCSPVREAETRCCHSVVIYPVSEMDYPNDHNVKLISLGTYVRGLP
jgi:hypothetical protein